METDFAEVAYRPDMPDFGAYLIWPSTGVDWIHPDDLKLAERLIPSQRVFRRVKFDGLYYHLEYGPIQLRVKPTMWTGLPRCDALVGDRVELISHFGQYDPGIATIVDVHCNRAGDRLEFRLRRNEMTLPTVFSRSHFRVLSPRFLLRVGYYMHEPPAFSPPPDLDWLNVGELD